MGQYEDFVQKCRQKVYPFHVRLYKHYILPRYVIKKRPKLKKLIDDPRNIIYVSFEDHKQLHKLRSEQYKKKARGDKIAFLKMDQQTEEAWLEIRHAGAEATHQILKDRKANFWDLEFQKEMAKRSLNKSMSRQIRSHGGKKGGKKRQQNPIIKALEKFCFSYQGEQKLCVFNCTTGGEVLEQLQLCIRTPLKRVSPLLTGRRKSLYKWSCKKISMTISSEAEKGYGFSERSETST